MAKNFILGDPLSPAMGPTGIEDYTYAILNGLRVEACATLIERRRNGTLLDRISIRTIDRILSQILAIDTNKHWTPYEKRQSLLNAINGAIDK